MGLPSGIAHRLFSKILTSSSTLIANHLPHLGGVYGSGVPIGMSGLSFVVALNASTIFNIGVTTLPAEAIAQFFVSRTFRSCNCCTGRAFIGYSFANASSWAEETSTTIFRTYQVTPSVHGGVVSDPGNV
jgi:hypothetical protein